MWRHCRHVGGQKQYIFSPLGNKIYFHAKLFHCFTPPTWPPWKPSMSFMWKLVATWNKINFSHMKDFVLGLASEQRRKSTRKSAIKVSWYFVGGKMHMPAADCIVSLALQLRNIRRDVRTGVWNFARRLHFESTSEANYRKPTYCGTHKIYTNSTSVK